MKKSILAITALALTAVAFAQDISITTEDVNNLNNTPKAKKLVNVLTKYYSNASAAAAESLPVKEGVFLPGSFQYLENTANFEDKETGVKITFDIAKHEKSAYGDAVYKITYNPAKIAGEVKIGYEARHAYGSVNDPEAPTYVVALIEIPLKNKTIKKAETIVLLIGKNELPQEKASTEPVSHESHFAQVDAEGNCVKCGQHVYDIYHHHYSCEKQEVASAAAPSVVSRKPASSEPDSHESGFTQVDANGNCLKCGKYVEEKDRYPGHHFCR